MKIHGVPEGWDVLKFDVPQYSEFYVDNNGLVRQCCESPHRFDNQKSLIVEKVQPFCQWQYGVFKNGWIAQDLDGHICWFASKPSVTERGRWSSEDDPDDMVFWIRNLLNPPVFSSGVEWTKRIQQVGPDIEKTFNN
jgi:hypothetical protein